MLLPLRSRLRRSRLPVAVALALVFAIGLYAARPFGGDRAAGAIGFSLFSVGALLASVVSTQISTSVTPLFVGFCVYSTAGLVAVVVGRRANVSQT